MVYDDYKCSNKECNHIIEDVSADMGQLPKSKKCPKCGSKCYRTWGSSVIIPENFKAMSTTSGNNWARNRMKNYKGQNGTKRFY